ELTNQAADAPHLPALLDELLANTGRAPREVSADAGYWSEDNLCAIAAVQSEAFIPPDKVKHSEWRNPRPIRGRIPKRATPADRMRRKLRTKRGRERYKLRFTTAESVFGQIKEGRGLRRLLHRGLEKVRAMWRFEIAVHNLLKIYRSGKWTVAPG
ncbi:MAG: transposase, partial [Deinococcus sp.]|nr:transposase [Deinococcus sp.]